jgi:hypothetical protein
MSDALDHHITQGVPFSDNVLQILLSVIKNRFLNSASVAGFNRKGSRQPEPFRRHHRWRKPLPYL